MAEPTSLDLVSFIDTTMPLVYLEKSVLSDSQILFTDDVYDLQNASYSPNKFGVKIPSVPRAPFSSSKSNDKTLSLSNTLVIGATSSRINLLRYFNNVYVCTLLVVNAELIDTIQSGNYTFHSLNKHLNEKRAILKVMPISEFISTAENTEMLTGAGIYNLVKNNITFNLSIYRDTMAVFNFTAMTYKDPTIFHKSYAQYGAMTGELLQTVGGTYVNRFFTDRSNAIWAGGYYPEAVTDPVNTVSNQLVYRKGLTKNYQPASQLSQNSAPTNERLYENTITNYSKFIDQSSVLRGRQIRGEFEFGLVNDEIMDDGSDSEVDVITR